MQYLFIIVIIVLALFGGGYLIGQKTNNDIRKENTFADTSSKKSDNQNNFDSKGEALDLSGQGLTKAPSYIFNITSLKSLNLSSNQLEGALQAEIRHLSHLQILDLSDNKFTGVPAEVGQLKNLLVSSNIKSEFMPIKEELSSHISVLIKLRDSYDPSTAEWRFVEDDINYVKGYLDELSTE